MLTLQAFEQTITDFIDKLRSRKATQPLDIVRNFSVMLIFGKKWRGKIKGASWLTQVYLEHVC